MSIKDLYDSNSSNNNLAHFGSLASLAAVDGEIGDEEMAVLKQFAHKLQITDAEFKEVMKQENKYPINHQVSYEKRLERFYDLMKIIIADHEVSDNETVLLKRYAIGLGFPNDKADKLIEKSVAIFTGKIAFEDFMYLVK
ncbi:TerB family tellurite resistance protein [Maribacter algicola]|uniref:TerB family tellurite resistance protein n=1 Tax=Meishania litoralis TaxID=3434685 RepID=A0ACC7LL51_9FLAO